MIALIDDDDATRAFLAEVLTRAGMEVSAHASGVEALTGLAARAPDLIVCDVVMPELSGLEFRTAYGARFPGRSTPFVFLSSMGEAGDVVRGLETGADDYLVKPVPPDVLVAKIRTILRRVTRGGARTFRGDLARFPFPKIVEFCELQALSGEVEVESGPFHATFSFRGGAVDEDAAGDAISRAFELTSGTFVVRTTPVDFGGLAAAAIQPEAEPALAPSDRPPGRLSAVTVGDRLVQLQTEYVTTPSPLVVSVGLRDGKTFLKRSARATGSREAVARQVEAQHAEVEREVRRKLAELAAARAGQPAPSQPPPPGAAFGPLLDGGLNAFLSGDHERALALWEQAAALEPEHRSLQVNLAVVRKKLGRT